VNAMDDEHLRELERIIGHEFRDRSLLVTALTHPSFCNENHSQVEHNQRLEFLGDAVISSVISSLLFRRFPEADEGFLTRVRAGLVSRESLAEAAREIRLGSYLRLGRGAAEGDQVEVRPSVLCAAFEALAGAIFLDAGFEVARTFITARLEPQIETARRFGERKDSKSTLQEACQATSRTPPRYQLIERTGPSHAPVFTVDVVLPDGRAFRGSGRSRKEAETEAAQKALDAIEPRRDH